jgi:hypothetical protein
MNQQIDSKQSSSTLLVLCILTLIGSVFVLLKGFIAYAILLQSNDTRSESGILLINSVYVIEFLTCFGTIVGAILMLTGKKLGLLIYQISSIVYIVLTAVFALFCFFSIIGIPVGLLQFIYLAISIVFLVLYSNQGKQLL